MRPASFTLLLVVFLVVKLNGQLTLTPQLGLENNNTTIRINELHSFTPLTHQLSPQLALKLDYKMKQHGAFVQLSSSRQVVNYSFADPETGMKNFQATAGNMQLRLEGGYQFNSKRMYFSKSKSAGKAVPEAATVHPSYRSYGAYGQRGHCGGYCNRLSRQFKSSTPTAAQSAKEKGWYMAVQPLVGAAFTPAGKTGITKLAASYLYNAGNWNTALVTGAGFEFGKNDNRKFIVTVQYLKGLGNMNKREVTTMTGAKESVTTLSSAASAWSLKAGIPISLSRKKQIVKPVIIEQPKHTEKKCGEYRSRCSHVI